MKNTRTKYTPAFKAKVRSCGRSGRGDDAGAGEAVRRPPEPNLHVEARVHRERGARVHERREQAAVAAARARGPTAQEDRRADGRARFFSQRARASSLKERRAMVDPRRRAVGASPVRAAAGIALRSVLRARADEPRAACADASDRRAASEVPVLREPQALAELRDEGREVNRKRVQRLMRLMGIEAMAPKPKTSEPHPEHRVYPYLLRGLAISRREPGLGDGHHVHPDEVRLRVPGRDHRLVLASGPVVAAVEHARLQLLRGGARRGARALRPAGDLQHRPGGAVHGRGVHQAAARPGHRDQHGRQGSLPRQRLRRAARGARSSTRRCTCTPTTAWPRRAPASGATSSFYNDERPHQALGYQTPAAFYAARRERRHDVDASLLHRLVPNLPVSPLALLPRALRMRGRGCHGRLRAGVTEKRLPIFEYL